MDKADGVVRCYFFDNLSVTTTVFISQDIGTNGDVLKSVDRPRPVAPVSYAGPKANQGFRACLDRRRDYSGWDGL